MGIQINGQTDTVTSTTAGGSVTVTPLAASTGLNVGTGASISSPVTNVLTLGTNNSERVRIGSTGSVGIGTNESYGDSNASFTSLSLGGNGTRYGLIELNKSDGTAGSWIDCYGTGGNGDLRVTTAGTSGAITFWTGGAFTEKVRIDSSGRVTMPYQPFFYAKAGAARDNQTSNPTVFNNVVTNVGNHYDGTTNYRFTAPVAGVYLFTSQPGYKETSDEASWKLYKNGAAFTDFVRVLGGLNSHSGWSCAALVYLNVNEYVHIGWDGSGGGYHQNADMSYFSGVLIG